MALWLLLITLTVSLIVCVLVTQIFNKPIGDILSRLVSESLSAAWHRYITFAIYIVGVSGGVKINHLERYITPKSEENRVIEMNLDRWVIEVYRTIIETLQGIAWMLLVFFIFALIAYVILRGFELKKTKSETSSP